jgi:predicted DNA-binding transcriptional regulator YafY
MIKTFTQHDAILYVYNELDTAQLQSFEKGACLHLDLSNEINMITRVAKKLDQVRIHPPKRMTELIKQEAREALGNP